MANIQGSYRSIEQQLSLPRVLARNRALTPNRATRLISILARQHTFPSISAPAIQP